MSVRWRGEGAQDRGSRPYQEDSWALRTLSDGALLAVVADGMGGHAGGAIASQLVVASVVDAVERGGSLAEGLQASNEAVRRGSETKPELDGMGSTLIAVIVKSDEVRWISVGDSPLYLVSSGSLIRLNEDHSMAPQVDALLARGILTAEEAAAHPARHTLREAIMGAPLQLIDQGTRRIGTGDHLLLCSDGIQTLDAGVITRSASKEVRELIRAVLAVGVPHQDNVTVIKLECFA
jgi:PPM family protein phosphatase